MNNIKNAFFIGICCLLILVSTGSKSFADGVKILGSKDIQYYKKIFEIQKNAKSRKDFKKADVYINRIKNKILLGQVYYQRYMHPRSYRASYKELHLWLKKYNDHPGSKQLYKLAKRRYIGGWKKTPKPKYILVPESLSTDISQNPQNKKSKLKHTYRMRSIIKKISWRVYKKDVTGAYNYLKHNRKRLSNSAYAEALGHIARGYYHHHQYSKKIIINNKSYKTNKTIIIAEEAYKKDRKSSWEANWWAGLEAFRVKQYAKAVVFFERVGIAQEKSSDWLYSAGYYWAGRSMVMLGNSSDAESYFHKATRYMHTFYGLLASQSMDNKPSIDFSTSQASSGEIKELLKIKGFERAVALTEIGQYARADRELKYIQPQVKIDMQYNLMQAGLWLKLPNAQFRIGHYLLNKGENISMGYLFPEIPYKPRKGYSLDKALVLAFVRQESQFRAYAKSKGIGAMGLMQLMPRTARFVARKTRVKPNSFHGTRRHYLYDPELSMTLGQSYIKMLLKTPKYENNLLLSIASYNAGPGNVGRWLRQMKNKEDPLLFIESLYSRETRIFMEKVISNFWIYRLRFNNDVPSLRQLANGQWPIYQRLD